MQKIKLLCTLFIVLFSFLIKANDSIKEISALRVLNPPQIDGKLTDEAWKDAPIAKDFVQFRPDNGAKAWQRSEVRFLYDNNAFYVGAMLYDTAPDSILTGMSERDNINNADYVGVYIDPQGTGNNGYGFFLTASGIQLDMKVDQYNEDGSWDAVWKSETSITDSGWIAEIRIPYTAIRFPKQDVQNWKVNVWRNIMRHRQNTNWNFVNREKDGILTQCGKLNGVSNIKPPLRLSLMPYVSGYYEKNPQAKKWNSLFNGGMDLKYGLDESFTLDMTLIPDFGQVQSDDKISNLTPFETFYNERRAFFTEGTELFNKLGIFYSRRIGGRPVRFDNASDNLKVNEKVISNPSETRMINATKFSGRTKHGLGIGIFNAMTGASFANIQDTITNQKRDVLTQPFTNYNMVVLDQDLKNNSSINLTNTNVLRYDDHFMANVTAGDVLLRNKSKTYGINVRGGVSNKLEQNVADQFGHAGYVRLEKIAGKFQTYVSYLYFSDKFDINDMGYLQRNNYTETNLYLRYEITKPFWIINDWYSHVNYYRYGLFRNNIYTSTVFNFRTALTFKNLYNAGINASYMPDGEKDYYESRVEGRFIKRFNKQYHIGGWINTDNRQPVSVYFNPGTRWHNEAGDKEYWLNIEMAYRFSDKLSFYYAPETYFTRRQKGWVSTNESNNNLIYFGRRNINEITNSFVSKYIFGKASYISLRARHYVQSVKYENQFYELTTNGDLKNSTYTSNHNSTYNAFNIDLLYAWRFAPGSEISIVWKNSIESNQTYVIRNYYDNLDHTWNSPQTNSFSIKMIYYLDFSYLKKAG